ncbi:MAG: glycosyltransferase family 2 protein [Candidatus Aenigmarchaeota archaeon]|nr:glycosyltransferase family 2 protein [Candidatus Aenigmarchaeota archaeon]
MKVSVVIPTLNEGKNLPKVLKDISKSVDEVIVVDGHSTDNTVNIAKKFGAKVIFDDVGKGSALRKGMEAAKGDIVMTMDADCSHKSSEIGLLTEGIKAGFDICMGSRFIQGGGTEDMPWYRKLGNKFFVFLVNLIWDMNYSDLCYGYRSFRKSCINKLSLKQDGFGIETEIAIKAAKKKLKVLEVPSYEKGRASGEGKLRTFSDGWLILKTIIREMFCD